MQILESPNLKKRLVSPRMVEQLQSATQDMPQAKSLFTQVDEYEKDIILNTLSHSRNTSDAAKKLGITRQALQYKIHKYHL